MSNITTLYNELNITVIARTDCHRPYLLPYQYEIYLKIQDSSCLNTGKIEQAIT